MSTKANNIAAYVVGVDLGGTNVRAAVVGRDEKIIGQARNPSDAKMGAARVVEQTALTVRQAIEAAGLKLEAIGAVGMAVPGHIDTRQGVIRWSPNFGEIVDGQYRMFIDVPFCGPVSEALGLPVSAGNDANVAALGEFRYGAGREVRDMVMLTLGTGIGSGVISDGRLLIGSTGGAVEFGHHVIVAGGRQCGCRTLGCLEAYCGTSGILERALRIIDTSNVPTKLFEYIADDRDALTPRKIDDAARAGDTLAQQVWRETGYYLGIGIGNAVHIFNPALVVLGGGIRNALGLIEAAELSMRNHTVASMRQNVRIVAAELGEDAGVMGAAELAWRSIGEEA